MAETIGHLSAGPKASAVDSKEALQSLKDVKEPITDLKDPMEDDLSDSECAARRMVEHRSLMDVLKSGEYTLLNTDQSDIEPNMIVLKRSSTLLPATCAIKKSLLSVKGCIKKMPTTRSVNIIKETYAQTLKLSSQISVSGANRSSAAQEKSPSSLNVKVPEKKLLKRLEINKYTNFLKDFNPDRSQRETRKLENLHFSEKIGKKV